MSLGKSKPLRRNFLQKSLCGGAFFTFSFCTHIMMNRMACLKKVFSRWWIDDAEREKMSLHLISLARRAPDNDRALSTRSLTIHKPNNNTLSVMFKHHLGRGSLEFFQSMLYHDERSGALLTRS
jgi:hypothetical protein